MHVQSICLLAIVSLALAGCGGDDLDRYRLRGKVTFEGQPVAFGTIFFEPTASVGKVAPTVYLGFATGIMMPAMRGRLRASTLSWSGGVDQSKKHDRQRGHIYAKTL